MAVFLCVAVYLTMGMAVAWGFTYPRQAGDPGRGWAILPLFFWPVILVWMFIMDMRN